MRRVLVIGCPGAGKSTFARRLRDATGLPLYYLDMLWHKPDRTTITREEFDARLQTILKGDAWIIDGNFARTLPKRLEYCDTVFFLDFPTDVCLEGVEERIGATREDMPWVGHEFDEGFRQYIIDFPTERRPQMVAALEDAAARRDVCVRTLHARAELETELGDMR
ncbi:adenylate kinase [Bifidobacterium pseudolongum subsp. globosum]|uniref:Adenylate kinase n=1 Tax=Bifidobacterium pseudolongum subsp. globosum TaxID=1690 RepID=A0A2N3QJD5_9BIFI|nr:AAA family ATPase [Bifidobacterium pseudolongum]PKU91542.1 adenylate kinase [Bifidobacterium pseudolongum subsp. globosum]PKV03532.1 adenylate kinase [Bifidobacterium pseudolongum subsp. globosum]